METWKVATGNRKGQWWCALFNTAQKNKLYPPPGQLVLMKVDYLLNI